MSGKIITLFLTVLVLPAMLFAQQGSVTGTITDESTGDAIVGANVVLKGTSMGAAANTMGVYTISNVPLGDYTLVVTAIGYTKATADVSISPGMTNTVDVGMTASVLQLSAVTVTSSFARERETPVAFTTIGEDHIRNNFTVQDIPHLFANTPGVYVQTDGGSGMGDSKVLIRGFDEQRIAVLINNVPVNDPESKKVYWSNWGSLPAAAQSIQIQRGAGTSLYGSGAMGGSINVVTKDAPANRSIGLNFTGGEYGIRKTGINYNSGLMGGNKAFIARFNYMEGNGWREDTYYRGLQYYFSGMFYPNENNTYKVILHGAPQYHAYSYYGFGGADFAKYGRDWNGHPHVSEGDITGTKYEGRGTNLIDVLFNATKIGEPLSSQKGGLVIGNGRASFDNNVFHKPQLELHHNRRFEGGASLTSTVFVSKGYGYGENLDSYYKVARSNNGDMSYDAISDAGVYQYRNYSDHFQTGLLSSYQTTIMGAHDLTVGGEFRYWTARHAGEILNTFDASDGLISYFIGNENQKFGEGDLYYDYTTGKPQFTGFGHILWNFMDGRLNVMTDAQVSTMTYNIVEDVPSSANYPGVLTYTDKDGKEVSKGDRTWTNTNAGASTAVYTLFDYKKTFTYISPKFGANYNINEELNMFANVSRAVNEPRVKFFFGFGSPNDALELEQTIGVELGFGYRSEIADVPMDLKLNLYNIAFSGKALRIQDPTKTNTQGYDYKGRRYIPIGDSNYRGVELALNAEVIPGLDWGFNVSKSANEWGEPDGSEGAQNLYSNAAVVAGTDYTDSGSGKSSYDANGKWDPGEAAIGTDFVGKFGNRVEVGMPQLIIGSTLNYSRRDINIGLALRNYRDLYIRENNLEVAVEKGADGEWGTTDDIMSSTLPSATIIDVVLRYNLSTIMAGTSLSLHVNNLLDTEYWQKGDSFGFGPGAAQTTILSFNITL